MYHKQEDRKIVDKKDSSLGLLNPHKELSLQILNKIAKINRLTNSIQIIILFLNYISKSGKKFLIIITLILEILNIIFANITFIPFLFLNLLSNIKILAYLIIIIYEVLNVYTITLTIKLVK